VCYQKPFQRKSLPDFPLSNFCCTASSQISNKKSSKNEKRKRKKYFKIEEFLLVKEIPPPEKRHTHQKWSGLAGDRGSGSSPA
jgi:hypothetical protein